MSIFQKSVVSKYLQTIDQNLINEKFKILKTHYSPEKIENIKLAKEEQYQEGFLRDIFVDVLGYTINPNPVYNLTRTD